MLKLKYTLCLLLPFYTLIGQVTTPPPNDEPEITFEKPKSALQQKLRLGGNVWLGFFGAFYIDVSPMAGLELKESGTVAGLGATFIYQGGFQRPGNTSVGPRIFVRQPIWRTIFAHAEYELMNAPSSQFYSFQESDGPRKWGASPLVGLGFYQNRQRQQRGSFISVMYNFGYNTGNGFISPQGLGGNGSPLVLRFGYLF